MKKQMGLAEIQPGMELLQPVLDEHGDVLVGAGTFLTEALIDALRRQQVEWIMVMEHEAGRGLDSSNLKKAEELADKLFYQVDQDLGHKQDQGLSDLFRAIREHAVARYSQRLAMGFELPTDTLSRLDLSNLGSLYFDGERQPLDLVRHEVELAAFPDIYFRIREVLDEHASNSADLAKVVGSDPSLTAKLLKLANSSFYGFPSSIDSLERAVTIIGVQEISMLAIGIAAMDVFTDIPAELTNMCLFWRHSVTCGLLAKSLARKTHGPSPERCFVGGLLHDLGRLLIYRELPYASVEILQYARENAVPTVEAEEIVLGYNHSLLGSLLLREWSLPRPICLILRHHHHPEGSPEPEAATVVQLADFLAHSLFMGEEQHVPLASISLDCIQSLGLTPDAVAQLVESCDQELDDLLAALF